MSDLQELPDSQRPKGIIRFEDEPGDRAARALEAGRLRDAERNINAMPEVSPMDRACKTLLGGMLAVARSDFSTAEQLLSEAASAAPVASLNGRTEPDATSLRLAARALQELGLVYRRRDLPEKAYRAHLSAYHLRNEHGSFEEVWETALSLGIDADLAGRYEDGQTWHRLAIEAGAKAAEQPEQKQAAGWTYLSASLGQCQKHDAAVDAARTAREWWHRHDLGAVTAAQADMKLGSALLKLGESLHETEPDHARPALEEALQWLTSAAEALEAFGPNYAADVRWCLEQKDFAQRLRDSLSV